MTDYLLNSKDKITKRRNIQMYLWLKIQVPMNRIYNILYSPEVTFSWKFCDAIFLHLKWKHYFLFNPTWRTLSLNKHMFWEGNWNVFQGISSISILHRNFSVGLLTDTLYRTYLFKTPFFSYIQCSGHRNINFDNLLFFKM